MGTVRVYACGFYRNRKIPLRIKAIGNSMAVPVMRWIGERIKKIRGKKNDNA